MYDVFAKLCAERGVNAYRVCKATGIRSGTITNWKKGRYNPKPETLQKIADYFGVSLEYMLTGHDVQTDVHGEDYYIDRQTAEKAQAIYKKYGALFDAAETATAEDVQFCIDFLRRVKGTNKDD